MEPQLNDIISQFIGLHCTQAQNPYGSVLALDFGELSLPKDALPKERPRGRWRLTIYSPWRLETDVEVVADYNVDGGAGGVLGQIARDLIGTEVTAASTRPPAWDLSINFGNGLRLVTFGDFDNDRDTAWYVTGYDGVAVSARPRARLLPSTDT